jgi:hypothetical protein
MIHSVIGAETGDSISHLYDLRFVVISCTPNYGGVALTVMV